MSDNRDIIGSLLSWMGQCTPREYVRFLKANQPDLFGAWGERDMVQKLEDVMARAWSSLATSGENEPEPTTT